MKLVSSATLEGACSGMPISDGLSNSVDDILRQGLSRIVGNGNVDAAFLDDPNGPRRKLDLDPAVSPSNLEHHSLAPTSLLPDLLRNKEASFRVDRGRGWLFH